MDNLSIIEKELFETEENIKEIKKIYSYIDEKIILNIINGVKVVAKDLNNENKKRKFVEIINGKYLKRQENINDLLINAIDSISKWLKDHEEHLSIIERKIFILSEEIINMQNEIIKFFNDYKSLKEIFNEFKSQVDKKLLNYEKRIKNLEIKEKIDIEIEKFGNLGFDLEIELFIILDNIFSGEFSLWYFQADKKQKEEKLNYLFNKLQNKLKKIKNEFIVIENLYNKIKKLPKYEINALNFIASQYREYNNKRLFDAIDIYQIATSSESEDEYLKTIKENSHIREFLTYNELIKDLGNCFLDTWSLI